MTEPTLLEATAELARHAGDVALRYFAKDIVVDRKSDGSPVTDADRSAESAAREWISRRFPDDGILGEEFGTTNDGAHRRWIVDPIDGTKSFIHGVPLWGTLAAVAAGEEILAGGAYFPALGELLVAAPGLGCWWNDRRARVSSTAELSQATALTTDETFVANPDLQSGWHRLTAKTSLSRSWGDCYGYLLVATGRAEVMVDPKLSPWDAAAVYPAIVEAGGVFTDWDGRATAFGGSAIATNAALSRDARQLLQGAPSSERGERA